MSAAIRGAADFLIDAGLLGWDRVANLRSLHVDAEFNRICLDPSSSYEEVFVAGLARRHFNFCLSDQSYFQLSDSGKTHRFAYYPNPFVDPDGLLDLIDDPLDFDAFEIADLRATAGRAPLRFDLAPGQYKDVVHPYAHFHLGHGELGRLSSRREFCANSFVMLVVRLYYPENWFARSCEKDQNGFENEFDGRYYALLAKNAWVNATYYSTAEEKLTHVR